MAGLLYAKSLPINDSLAIRVPTVGEILDDEDTYFEIVSTIIATPYDMMVQLDDAGIDFTKISSFELFCLTIGNLQDKDTSLVLGDLSMKRFAPAVNGETNEMVLVDVDQKIVIDAAVHELMCSAIRKILWIKKNEKMPANEEAKRYMLSRARRKLKRMEREKQQKDKSQLENLIIGLVNTEQFPYNYQTVRDITIYQFYSSLHQISHKIKFDNTMIGYYAGTVKLEDLSLEDRTWFNSQ